MKFFTDYSGISNTLRLRTGSDVLKVLALNRLVCTLWKHKMFLHTCLVRWPTLQCSMICNVVMENIYLVWLYDNVVLVWSHDH